MLERALNWARAGWPVFPCLDDGKPAIREWQKLATTDEDTIRSWCWGRVACVPGLAGCFVIDVDVKNGKDGEASLARLEEEHGFEAWQYPQQSTPSGGCHLFLLGKSPTSVQHLLGAGLDTRGGTEAGGLGFVYCYGDAPPCNANDCPAAPDTLQRLLERGPKARREDTQTPKVELDQPANIARALNFIKDVPSPAEGERNISVFKTACTLKDLGLSLAKIFEVLEDHPSVTGIPPLCEDNMEEFNATVRSAWTNGQRQPGIDAIDEENRDKAAEGYSVPENGANAESGGRGSRKRLGLWSERRDRPPPEWVLRGLLSRGSLAGLYGPGGSYKSFLALDIARAISTGSEFAGIATEAGPIVYISGEGSVEPRARAVELKTKLQDTFAILDGLDLNDDNQLMEAIEDINLAITQSWNGKSPVLIVVDTLARAAPGQDENSAKDMGEIVSSCDGLKKLYGCCVLLVHHTPKGGTDWRGSTAVWNALDTALSVKRTGHNTASLKVERQKDGQIGTQWSVTLEEVETGRERDGEAEKSLVVRDIRKKEYREEEPDSAAHVTSVLVDEARGQLAASILDASAPGFEIGRKALLNQMLANSPQADPHALSKWIGAVVKRGQIDPTHPLAAYLHSVSGPSFSRKPDPLA
jgi:hypothetical protein